MEKSDSKSVMSTISLPAKLENLPRFLESVISCAKDQGLDRKRTGDIELILEEALVNIISYAYKNQVGNAQVKCLTDSHDRLYIEIIDSGRSFNLLSLDDPNLKDSLEDRKIGGLGIFLIKQFIDDFQYKREDDKNVLTLTVYLKKNRGSI